MNRDKIKKKSPALQTGGFFLFGILPTMRPTNPTSEHFIHAEKLRDLRLQLAETADHLRRKEILRQIEDVEDESKDQFKP